MNKVIPTFATLLSALAMACAMAAFSAAPAAAGNGVKCNGCVNSKDVKNGQVKKNDLSRGLREAIFGIDPRGDTGALSSNGPLKAWAKIAADGTVIACDRCDANSAETRKVGAGLYHVDFTPLGSDISGRPYATMINVSDGEVGQISAISLGADPSTVLVRTEDAGGAAADKAFTVLVY